MDNIFCIESNNFFFFLKCKNHNYLRSTFLFLHYDDFMDKVVSLEPNFRLVFS